ncbi:hypothetical protein EAS17NKHM_025500 [Enterobacter asburiae]|uniref:hypothetical protein n=1 Tax=Enterobacter asburiae TaxID=61645 RepID=UPI0010CA57FB|nr:hypothetical protein [Enterobacter asburiae]BBJ59154.1 hypothetical protein EAS17NKHM_025500 [Enterobacter asburiae]
MSIIPGLSFGGGKSLTPEQEQKISGAEQTERKGQPSGYASLSAEGRVPSSQLPSAGYSGDGVISRADWLKILWSQAWPDARDNNQASGRFSFDADGKFQVNYFWTNTIAYTRNPGKVILLPSFTDPAADYDDGDLTASVAELTGINDALTLSSYFDKDVLTITNHATSEDTLMVKADWFTVSGGPVFLVSADNGQNINMSTAGISIPPESSITIRWDHSSQKLQEI